MRNKNTWLILIGLLIAFSLWVDLSKYLKLPNPLNSAEYLIDRNVDTRLGLDLRGGLQALLEADVPADTPIAAEDLANAKSILENRANALGVSEVVMQVAGDRRIVADFPGISNPEEVVAALKQTALLEFVDMGATPLPEGSVIQTDFGVENAPATTESGETIYHTVMTGAGLKTAAVQRGQLANDYLISFELKPDTTTLFGEYTSTHIGQYLAIVLDKRVISAPVIQSAITDGAGQISGNFTQDAAQTLAVQLRSGALPIPIKVVESRTVGPTLGEESLRKSVTAGLIGLAVIILFMALYYRLPGIAGFILSVGMAVDANVLIFERLKEELRGGRNLRQAIDLAWSRAWPSIRDSNISTLITSFILFVFGSSFGASIVKGFSVTLALGVLVSMFTAITVTRTFLHTLLDGVKLNDHPRWFGL